MKSFGEQLIAARKAQNMTQEQLAEALNITRQGISNWERNLALPDAEVIQQLSRLLGYEFELPETPETEKTAPEKAVRAKKSSPFVSKKKAALLSGLSFIAGLLVMFLFMQLISPLTNAPIGSKVNPNTIEYYTRNRTYDSDKACVEITVNENPSLMVADPGYESGYGWFYTFYFTETNGIDFYPETYTECFFDDRNIGYPADSSKDDMIVWWGDSKIPAYGQQVVRGGIPEQNAIGLGVKIAGKDANGNPLEFYGYIELSHEKKEGT